MDKDGTPIVDKLNQIIAQNEQTIVQGELLQAQNEKTIIILEYLQELIKIKLS